MKCSTAEEMVNRYINRTLSIKELEAFLDHIEGCPRCREELETYFIVYKAMQQLDEEGSVLDFQKLLKEDMTRSRRQIIRQRVQRFFMVAGGYLLILILGSFFIYAILEISHYL